MEVPENAPAHCPGPESNNAGKGSACAGCPNQSLCASGVSKSFNEGVEMVKQRLSSVKHKVAVLSGKGGVGKSTVTCLIARHLASMGKNVGVIDVDICGPSMPRLMGIENEDVHMSGSGWCPVYVEENLAVMSIGFLLKDPDEAVVWRGNRKTSMIQDFLGKVDWGPEPLDFLLLDTPPGTSDEHISTASIMKSLSLTAVIVATPQEVSLLDVRKEIDFCRKVGITILGVIENMSTFVCPKCKMITAIFPANTGGVPKMAEEMGVSYLGSLPIEPLVTRACDEGRDPLTEYPDSQVVSNLKHIIQKIINELSSLKTSE